MGSFIIDVFTGLLLLFIGMQMINSETVKDTVKSGFLCILLMMTFFL